MAGRPILLDKPMNVSELLSGQGFTFSANFKDDVHPADDSTESDSESLPELSGQVEDVNLVDEDLYEYNQVAFTDLVPLMTPVDKEGMVKKRIFREGKGDIIPRESRVTYHYKAFQEFEACAFDSTYARKKPEVSNLDNVLYGLSIAIATMRVREKSQFLIEPEWAYGVLGIPPSIPPQSTILFEIEVLKFVPVGENDADEVEKELLDSKDYKKNYDRAVKLCGEAKYLVKDKKERPAIRNYNEAIRLLSNVALQNEDQEADYVTLLLRLYTNLAVAHNRLEQWPKCCIQCQEVYKLCNTFYRSVDDKVYYQHAKALFGLNEFKRADDVLRKAAKNASYDRPNKEIMTLYKKIQDAKAEAIAAEKVLAEAMFKKNAEAKK